MSPACRVALSLLLALGFSVSKAQTLPGGTLPGGTLGADTPYPPLDEQEPTAAPAAGGAAVGGGGSDPGTAGAPESAFSRFDTNGDGLIGPSEAEAFPALRDNFERVDSDADGQLSPGEVAVVQ